MPAAPKVSPMPTAFSTRLRTADNKTGRIRRPVGPRGQRMDSNAPGKTRPTHTEMNRFSLWNYSLLDRQESCTKLRALPPVCFRPLAVREGGLRRYRPGFQPGNLKRLKKIPPGCRSDPDPFD